MTHLAFLLGYLLGWLGHRYTRIDRVDAPDCTSVPSWKFGANWWYVDGLQTRTSRPGEVIQLDKSGHPIDPHWRLTYTRTPYPTWGDASKETPV